MKKFLIIIISALFLTVLLSLPNIPRINQASATEIGEEIPECCKLRHNIDIGGTDYDKDTTLAPSNDRTQVNCPITGTLTAESKWAAYCTVDTIMTISDWIFWLALTLAGIMIVVAGVMFVTSAGSPEKAGKAKSMLTYSVIGFAVALLAKFIPAVARYFIGL